MKKVLLAFVASGLLFASCDPEETNSPVSVTLSSTEAIETTLQGSPKTIMFQVTNGTNQSANIKWELSKTADPAGFEYMVNGSSATSGTLEMEANEVKDITLVVDPKGNPGPATGTLTFYDEDNQIGTTKTFGYNVQTIASYFKTMPRGALSGSIGAGNDKDYYIDVVNTTNTPIQLTWAKDEKTLPQGWNILICDPDACHAPFVTTREITVAAMDTIEFKATFQSGDRTTPYTGSSEMDAIFYVKSDSAASREMHTINHTAN